MSTSGYEEFDHTADWGIRVWAEDIYGLLLVSARGMFELLEAVRGSGREARYSFDLKIDSDPEKLLVDFLSELLYISEKDTVAFDKIFFSPQDNQIQETAFGYPITGQKKEIKAVTYHNLNVKRVGDRVEAAIVFDV